MSVKRIRGDSDVVGDDRDVASVLSTLRRGVSLVVIGPLGSGKSHFLRHLVERLEEADDPPLLLRPSGPHSALAHGALMASRDPRAERLREGRPLGNERPIVIIDDAQELDPASVSAVVRAVYSGHATALFALTVTRDGSTRPPDGSADAAQMATDLWLRGLADRIDLAALTPRDADRLLETFAAPDLDALTRASIVALADGSRMLLRELAAEAALAARSGRDPIDALCDSPAHGRLSDALAAHVGQLGTVERSTLATLGRVPGIPRADAARFLPSTSLDALVNARLVYDDATPTHRLTANPALAREADRRAGSEGTDALLAGVITRMFAPTSEWWSEPLAVVAARSWLHGRALGPALDDVPSCALARATLDASRRANDDGEHAEALAHAELGLRSADDTVLLVEKRFAEAAQGATVDFDALLERLSGATVDTVTLVRCVRVAVLAGASSVDAIDTTLDRLAALGCPDARGFTELDMIRAGMLGFRMDWAAAAVAAESLFAQHGNSVSLRVRAATLAGLSHTCLGAGDKGKTWFLRAHRAAGERGGITPITTNERLHIAMSEIMAAGVGGTDLGPILARLGGEVDAAARQGDAETSAMAGLVLSCAFAVLGDTDQAARELDAAVRRARPPVASDNVPIAQIAVARALALSDHADEARSLLDRMDQGVVTGFPSLEHARMVAESYVSAALGRRAEALIAARSAASASAEVPALRARDLYQMAVLGDADDVLAEMHRLAEESEVPATAMLSEAATSLVDRGGPESDIIAAMRLGTPWDSHDGATTGIGVARAHSLGRAESDDVSDTELTRREREIALLVAEGLGNREIAERLYLSVRTVESHVYQARAKLGVASRVELGRTVAPVRQSATAERPRIHGRP